MLTRSFLPAALLIAGGCGSLALAGSPAEHGPESFGALPEVVVCVVDRSTESGLRDLSARRGHDGETLILVDGRVVPLETVHAPGVIAGYAAAEPWFAGDSVAIDGTTFQKVQGERRIPATEITRVADFRGIPVFASVSDEGSHDAVYLPTRPGCVFQAYVRSDLL